MGPHLLPALSLSVAWTRMMANPRSAASFFSRSAPQAASRGLMVSTRSSSAEIRRTSPGARRICGSSGHGSPEETLATISAMRYDLAAPRGPTMAVNSPAGILPGQSHALSLAGAAETRTSPRAGRRTFCSRHAPSCRAVRQDGALPRRTNQRATARTGAFPDRARSRATRRWTTRLLQATAQFPEAKPDMAAPVLECSPPGREEEIRGSGSHKAPTQDEQTEERVIGLATPGPFP